MSIASEITRLQNAKASLKTSIESKGVTVPSATTLDGYASLVDSIPTGGQSPTGQYAFPALYGIADVSSYATAITQQFMPKLVRITIGASNHPRSNAARLSYTQQLSDGSDTFVYPQQQVESVSFQSTETTKNLIMVLPGVISIGYFASEHKPTATDDAIPDVSISIDGWSEGTNYKRETYLVKGLANDGTTQIVVGRTYYIYPKVNQPT